MPVTLISDPSYAIQVSPAVVSRWLATESPNNFRLQRKDFVVTNQANSGGKLSLTLSASFTGNVGDSVSVYNSTTGAMLTGNVTAAVTTSVTTDITWTDGMVITYFNDNTLRGGYYFEGRLTINDVLQVLTVIASPNSFGVADLDVSGVLRISTTMLKTGDYSADIIAEASKSGKFTFEYRECWYGSNESYTAEGNTWYYSECVRSEEQGSNIHEFVPSSIDEVPFFNSFDQPVYSVGLPFDLSFICPDDVTINNLVVTIKRYNATNTPLGTTTKTIAAANYKGKVCSLNIDPATLETSADHFTVEITTT